MKGRSEANITPMDRANFLLNRKGWTKRELSEQSGLSYARVLSALNNNYFSRDTLEAFARVFHCSTDWLLGQHPDQLREMDLCAKALCGLHATWVVIREGMPYSEGIKCCDDHAQYYFSRDRRSFVHPIKQYLKELKTLPDRTVSITLEPTV